MPAKFLKYFALKGIMLGELWSIIKPTLSQIWAQQLEIYIDRVPLHVAHMFYSLPVGPIWPCSTRSPYTQYVTIRGGEGVIELGRPMIPLMTDRGPRQKAYFHERPDSTQEQWYRAIKHNRNIALKILSHLQHYITDQTQYIWPWICLDL
jgi:hypothetical protein